MPKGHQAPRKFPAGAGAIEWDPALSWKRARKDWPVCHGADLRARATKRTRNPQIRASNCLQFIAQGTRYVYSSLSGGRHCGHCALAYESGENLVLPERA